MCKPRSVGTERAETRPNNDVQPGLLHPYIYHSPRVFESLYSLEWKFRLDLDLETALLLITRKEITITNRQVWPSYKLPSSKSGPRETQNKSIDAHVSDLESQSDVHLIK